MGRTRIIQVAVAAGLASVLVGFLTLGGGCSKPQTTVTTPVHQGVTLTVTSPGDPANAMIKKYSRDWLRRTGAELKYESAKEGPLPESDVVILDPVDLPQYAAAGQLHNVPDAYFANDQAYNWNNLLTLYRGKLLAWDEAKCGMPLIGEATVCYFRDDLFAAAEKDFKIQHKRPLTPPATWDEFLDIAQFFDSRPKEGFETSLPPMPKSDLELDRAYFSIAAPFARDAVKEDEPKKPSDVEMFSFQYDLATGACRLDAAGFVEALNFLRKTQASRPSDSSLEPEEYFRLGKSVLCIGRATYVGRMQSDSKVRKKFGVCPVPGTRFVHDYETGERRQLTSNNVPYQGVGGFVAVVPKTSKQPEVAFELLAELSSGRAARESVVEPLWGGGPYRSDQFSSQIWDLFDLGGKTTSGMLDAVRHSTRPNIINPVVRLRIPNADAHAKVLMEEIRRALGDPKVDSAQALQAAKARWEALDAKEKDFLNLYRVSMGFKPKK